MTVEWNRPFKTIGIIGGLGPQAEQDIEGWDSEDTTAITIAVVEHLRRRGADNILLACTELPILLRDHLEEPDIINPNQLLAEAAVRYAIT